MKMNGYISKKEHNLLLLVAFTALVFVLATFSLEFIRYTESLNSPFSYSPFKMPGLHFLTFFIFIALFTTKRYLVSSLLTIFYAFVFIYGLTIRYFAGRSGKDFSLNAGFFEQVYREANTFDYIAAFFISILLLWQISILLRMLIKTTQKEKVLP